jgi:hypothetical protein
MKHLLADAERVAAILFYRYRSAWSVEHWLSLAFAGEPPYLSRHLEESYSSSDAKAREVILPGP